MISTQFLKKFFIIALCFFANAYPSQTDNEGALEIANKTDKDLAYNIYLPNSKYLKSDTILKQSSIILLLPIVKTEKPSETYTFYLGDFDAESPAQHFYIRDPRKTAKITLKTKSGEECICLS